MPEQCRYKLQIDVPIALFTHYSSHFMANKCNIMAFCSTGYNKCYQMRQLTDACNFVIAKLWTCFVPLDAPVVLLRRAPTLACRRSASQNDPSCMDTRTITAGVMWRHQCGSKLLIEQGPAKKIYENDSTMWGSSHKSNPVYNLWSMILRLGSWNRPLVCTSISMFWFANFASNSSTSFFVSANCRSSIAAPLEKKWALATLNTPIHHCYSIAIALNTCKDGVQTYSLPVVPRKAVAKFQK